MSERSYRIRTDITKDKVVRIKTEQDYDFLEILSLKIKQEDAYKLHVSNYGVIVGRVLANDAFGIPNAKVSVFIELDDEDELNSEITNIYPYKTFQSVDSDGRRYNLLPDESNDDCYQVVGSFPNKRLVLDNDTYLEVFDKYWKYTTVTNKSGDYMIFGVPTGQQQIHIDIDLSDIGVLSQKPIDFIYKGYNQTQFENAQQFKNSTNLDNLTQLLSQNKSVHVYPFWGDKDLEEIAISRCDVQVQYKFEPTCVFFGAIMTDNYNNNIGHKCSPSKYVGFNRHLVTGEGTIEMIRKTPDNLVEEFQIQGNRLIDGDGVWCYQIPMNLDFVGTDEFGNIVPTDDPKKGIPTRTSVRFRVSMQETSNEGVSRHRAKYLIPNVQNLVSLNENDVASTPYIVSGKKFEQCYEFGSATLDEYYRDLYWNKVYSVKNYIPRLQTTGLKRTQNYSAIRTVNSNNDVNPAPFNHARFRLAFGYRVLCMIMTVVFAIICGINAIVSGIADIKILGWRPFKWICSAVGCIGVHGGLTEDEDGNIEFFPCCSYDKCMECEERGCTKETSYKVLINSVQQSLSQEYDTVNLDFYNDWLNGSLYMPLWFWRKTKKKKYFFGLFSKKAVNSFCSCSKNFPKLRLTQNCALPYNEGDYSYAGNDKDKKYHEHYPKNKTFTVFGVIKEFVNKAGLNIYYYAPGIPNEAYYKEKDDLTSYIRLYSTDIILLGSLNSCDLDNLPNVFTSLPTTTANIPFIATIQQSLTEEEGSVHIQDENAANIIEGAEQNALVEVTGMDWLHSAEKHKPKYGAGLFMDLACNAVYTKPKSCTNLERLCELGVSLDVHMDEVVAKNGILTTNTIFADGMITRYELVDNETRAIFASLNNNGLTKKIYNPNTGYFTYKLRYVYPIDFDGHMKYAYDYTSMMDIPTYDISDDSYNEFRFGPTYIKKEHKTVNLKKFFYSYEGSNKWTIPVFNNSFYFYFGIHEGSTAIDKFNSRFYATCYKNTKYPFTMTIETEPAKWCIKDKNDYATIKITLNGIKVPYSYVLYNEFNEEILEEDGLTNINLNFGYEIKNNGGDYKYQTVNGKKELIKNGEFTEFNTGNGVTDSNGNSLYVDNGTYKIEIKDANGNKLTQNIIIEQVPIGLKYETVELGEKYYNDIISKKDDFCNENEFYGEIRITAVTIDGHDFYVKFEDDISSEGNGKYILKVYSEDGKRQEEVEIIFTPQQDDENSNVVFEDCICKNSLIDIKDKFNDGLKLETDNKIGQQVLVFMVWKPSTFNIFLNQRCNGIPNDNIANLIAVVKNGETFNAYINEMPMKFILGKNEQISSYNKKFYKVGATTPKELPGWFNVHDEEAYCFSSTTMTYEDIWSDFVTVITEQNTDPNKAEDMNYYLSSESIYNILTYKFEKIFNMSKNVYVCGDQDNKMAISHTGGKSPILYRGHYPLYNEATSENNPDNPMTLKKFSSDGSVTLNQTYPNIIGYNYTYIDSETDMPTFITNAKEPIFNTIYDEAKKQGNYFAAFTRNGGVKIVVDSSGEEKCVYSGGTGVNSIKYQQIPYMAHPAPYAEEELICSNADEDLDDSYNTKIIQGSGQNKPYFRGEFVDRRLDYDFIIFTPYAGSDSPIISSNDNTYKESTEEEKAEPIWKKGRISGHTFNGVEMAYNKDYEIIGYYLNKKEPTKSHLLEYYYGADVVNGTETCLRKFKFDKNFSNLLNCVCGNTINVGMMVTGYTEFQNQDIITYHNKDVKFKRFYKTILKCSNKKYDINDFYWAGKDTIISAKTDVNYGVGDGNIIGVGRNPEDFGIELCDIGSPINKIPNTMFSYNHSDFGGADKGRYNADFGVNNYPLKRLLDIGNIESCEKLTFTCSSCSYEVDVDVEDASSNDINTTTNTESGSVSFITGMTQECGETEFIIDCRNMINPVDSSLEECAANKGYNVLYTYNNGFFFSKDMRIKCKVKNDTYNTTHLSYSYNPILFRIKRRDIDENSILELKHHSNSISDMEKEIRNNYRIANFSYDKDSVKDIKRISKKILFMTLEGNYWVQSNDDKKIAYDDNSNVKNVIYNVDVNDLKKNGDWFDVVGVLLKRNYVNNSGDNLTKKISTLQVTSIYDVRRFKFELYCASEVRYIGTEVENETNVSGVVTDVKGGATSNSEGEITGVNVTPTTGTVTGDTQSTATTIVQRTIYTVYTYIGDDKNKLIDYNQQFYSIGGEGENIEYNTDGLSAIFAIGTKFTSDVTISNRFDERPEYEDYLAIDFDIYWSGDLADKTLEKAKNDTARLYIKMPNKLIYQLNFNIGDFKPLYTDECTVDSTPPKEEEPEPSPGPVSIINDIKIANNLPMEGGENLKVRVIAGTNNYDLDKNAEQTQTIPSESGYNISVSVPKACLYRSDGQVGESSWLAFYIYGSNIQWEGINENCGTFSDHADEMKWRPSNSFFTNCISSITYKNGDYKVNITITIVEN